MASFELQWLHGLLSQLDHDAPKKQSCVGESLLARKGVISAGRDSAGAGTAGTNRQSTRHQALASG